MTATPRKPARYYERAVVHAAARFMNELDKIRILDLRATSRTGDGTTPDLGALLNARDDLRAAFAELEPQ